MRRKYVHSNIATFLEIPACRMVILQDSCNLLQGDNHLARYCQMHRLARPCKILQVNHSISASVHFKSEITDEVRIFIVIFALRRPDFDTVDCNPVQSV